MKLRTLLVLSFLSISTVLFSQNHKSVLIKKIEGVSISYSIIDGKSECVFSIDNSSANAAQIEFDVKIFYSNNESKELHKKVQIPASQKQEVKARNKKKKIKPSIQQNLKITNVEVHNVKFSGI